MRTKSEIDVEIKALKALKPAGKFSGKTEKVIRWMIEELEDGVDDTAEEWSDMDDEERQAVMDARLWRDGVRSEKPSEGWGWIMPVTRKKEIKFHPKKISTGPRPQIEILDPKKRPFDLEKTGQYSEHWKKAAAASKEDPPGRRP